VCAALDNTPVLYDKNLVCLEDGGKAMGDDNRGPACKGRFERPPDGGFGWNGGRCTYCSQFISGDSQSSLDEPGDSTISTLEP
jgi:hypothetical protein